MSSILQYFGSRSKVKDSSVREPLLDDNASSLSEGSHGTRDSSDKYASCHYMGGEEDVENSDKDINPKPRTKEEIEIEKQVMHEFIDLDLDYIKHQKRDIWCFEPKGFI